RFTLLVLLGLGEDTAQLHLSSFGGLILLLAFAPLRFLWTHRNARSITLHVEHLVGRWRAEWRAGPWPLGHLRTQTIDDALDAPAIDGQAAVLMEALRRRLVMLHRPGPAHHPRQGGRATFHNPERLVQRSAATALAIGVIVATQAQGAEQGVHRGGPGRIALFVLPSLVVLQPPIRIVEQLFQGVPAIPQQSLAESQLQPLGCQGSFRRQTRLGYGDKGLDLGGGFLADRRLEFFFASVAGREARVCC